MEQHHYRLAGFEICSELRLSLPALRPGSASIHPVVRVFAGGASALHAPQVRRVLLEVAPDDYWLEIPGVARYRVRNGSEVFVQVEPGAPRAAVTAYFHRYALPALCRQRDLLVVNATALAYGERAVLLVGQSGCGKSTLGAVLAARGASVLSDDHCIIDTADGRAMAQPSAERFELWADAAEALGYPLADARQPIAGVPKFAIAVGRAATAAVPVHLVLVLGEPHPRQPTPHVERVPALAALASLAGGPSSVAVSQGMNRAHAHLNQCQRVLAQAQAGYLLWRRSTAEWRRVADLIEQMVTDATIVHRAQLLRSG